MMPPECEATAAAAAATNVKVMQHQLFFHVFCFLACLFFLFGQGVLTWLVCWMLDVGCWTELGCVEFGKIGADHVVGWRRVDLCWVMRGLRHLRGPLRRARSIFCNWVVCWVELGSVELGKVGLNSVGLSSNVCV